MRKSSEYIFSFEMLVNRVATRKGITSKAGKAVSLLTSQVYNAHNFTILTFTAGRAGWARGLALKRERYEPRSP
jgi:hypothetical protein